MCLHSNEQAATKTALHALRYLGLQNRDKGPYLHSSVFNDLRRKQATYDFAVSVAEIPGTFPYKPHPSVHGARKMAFVQHVGEFELRRG